MKWPIRLLLIVAVWTAVCPAAARAETGEIRVAKQYGLGYLQMMLMEEQKLVEKHAVAAGLGDIKVTWATFRSSDVMNDALLSGSLIRDLEPDETACRTTGPCPAVAR